jgi:hypothetical protein
MGGLSSLAVEGAISEATIGPNSKKTKPNSSEMLEESMGLDDSDDGEELSKVPADTTLSAGKSEENLLKNQKDEVIILARALARQKMQKVKERYQVCDSFCTSMFVCSFLRSYKTKLDAYKRRLSTKTAADANIEHTTVSRPKHELWMTTICEQLEQLQNNVDKLQAQKHGGSAVKLGGGVGILSPVQLEVGGSSPRARRLRRQARLQTNVWENEVEAEAHGGSARKSKKSSSRESHVEFERFLEVFVTSCYI